MKPSRYIASLFGGVARFALPACGLRPQQWRMLFPLIKEYRLESTLFAGSDATLVALAKVYRDLYQVQRRATEVILQESPFLAEHALFIQGFPWNAEFGNALPISLRGDVDILVSPEMSNELQRDMLSAGFKRRVYIDQELTAISEPLAAYIAARANYGFPKAVPWSRIIRLGATAVSENLLPWLYGSVVSFRDGPELLFQIEENYGYAVPGLYELLHQDILTEPWLSGRRLNAQGMFLTATIRVHRGIQLDRLSLRTLLEAAILYRCKLTDEAMQKVSEILETLNMQVALTRTLDLICLLERLDAGMDPAAQVEELATPQQFLLRKLAELDRASPAHSAPYLAKRSLAAAKLGPSR